MTDLAVRLVPKLQAMAQEYATLQQSLADPAVLADHQQVRELSIRRAALEGLVSQYQAYQSLQKQIHDDQLLIQHETDADLLAMAKAELPELQQQASDLLDAIAGELVTAEDRAVGSVILEVRAGTGGAEAALWAGDIYQMYQAYAAANHWSLETLSFSPGEQGGVRQVVAAIQGQGVWQQLGYEGGVHCVKRVPATETQGRVHTSTATVAVLPEPQKVQLDIPDADVQIHVTTAQGPGGQNVNKVATAVHMIHLPTGIEARMQESKSQQQNRVKGWQLLRARVYDHYQREKDAQRAADRSEMIGSGQRSERIRTYRYKENVAVDHRLNASFSLQSVMAGNLGPIVDQLIQHDRLARLAAL
jgi:peptide chain release factor 1